MLADLLDEFWKLEGPWAFLGDLHRVTPPLITGLVVTLAGAACGMLVGAERERREKPAGLRTLALICLGSVIFTEASVLLADGHSDRTRIAAQVVTGVGFLGAGAIIRNRGRVIGVTTGASIWAVAAVGVVIGSGYVAAGVALTLLVLLTLAGVRNVERWAEGPCRRVKVRVVARRDGGKTYHLVNHRVSRARAVIEHEEVRPDGETIELRVNYCEAHRSHRLFLAELAKMPQVLEMTPLGATPAEGSRPA